jgi:hypothetical protein
MKPTTDPAPSPGEAREKMRHEFVKGVITDVYCVHCGSTEAEYAHISECPSLLRLALNRARQEEEGLRRELATLDFALARHALEPFTTRYEKIVFACDTAARADRLGLDKERLEEEAASLRGERERILAEVRRAEERAMRTGRCALCDATDHYLSCPFGVIALIGGEPLECKPAPAALAPAAEAQKETEGKDA